MDDRDFLLALKLQEEFNRELEEEEKIEKNLNRKRTLKNSDDSSDEDNLNKTCNLVHPQWETLDPTPDVKALFNAFDTKFFQGRLKCVELEWSKRMYSCAGICYTRKNIMGMAITIRLSEPLLKLRSRKDLVETLLHEMIHAYCGVLGIREGNGGHGPNFKKIMNGINKVAGTNITVYHTFHDEVNNYKTHWWRCNGICQHRPPFFGYVKRTSNRAPGPSDIWWKQHLNSCGGSFLKVKEPQKKKKLKTENKSNKLLNNNINNNIRKYFGKGIKSNGGGTLVLKPTTPTSSNQQTCTSTPVKTPVTSGNLSNVVGFKNLGSNKKSKSPITFENFETGYSLLDNNTNTINIESSNKETSTTNRDKVRNVWANKFPTSAQTNEKKIEDKESKQKESEESSKTTKEVEIPKNDNEDKNNELWEKIDEDVMIREVTTMIVDISSDEDKDNNNDDKDNNNDEVEQKPSRFEKIPNTTLSSKDRQHEIKKEILETSDIADLTESDIELIDDDYDDVLNDSGEIGDTNLIDDLFGEDTLLRDFQLQNDLVITGTKYHRNSNKDVICCPICQEYLSRENLSDHLDGCTGIKPKVIQGPGAKTFSIGSTTNKTKSVIKKNKSVTPSTSTSANLPGTSSAFSNMLKDNNDDLFQTIENENFESEGLRRRRGLVTSTHTCPVCTQEVDVDKINEHLDICLKS